MSNPYIIWGVIALAATIFLPTLGFIAHQICSPALSSCGLTLAVGKAAYWATVIPIPVYIVGTVWALKK